MCPDVPVILSNIHATCLWQCRYMLISAASKQAKYAAGFVVALQEERHQIALDKQRHKETEMK